MHILDVLKQRGFIAQINYEDELYEHLDKNKITFYCGFDPTADSLQVGHYIPLMAMRHLQAAGHRPITLAGGGTTMVGDPSGKTDIRQMLTKQQIADNVVAIKQQLSKFLDFSDGKALMVDNTDWLLQLNYIDFLRDIGAHFSVNRMLAADCYKQRLERGLTFLEFNYMVMQSFDFYKLNQMYNCTLQLGGDDQWSNILSGADLIRRKEGKEAYAMTLNLITNADGTKMGKTVAGAVWLDKQRTTPYDFYQYWRNADDRDVEKYLALLTMLPMDEVKRLGNLPGSEINQAKDVLAYELTKQIHGEEEANKAQAAAAALFGGGALDGSVPTTAISREQLQQDARLVTLCTLCGLTQSRGEARKLILGGGLYVDDEKVTDANDALTVEQLESGVMLRKGKKNYHRLILE